MLILAATPNVPVFTIFDYLQQNDQPQYWRQKGQAIVQEYLGQDIKGAHVGNRSNVAKGENGNREKIKNTVSKSEIAK